MPRNYVRKTDRSTNYTKQQLLDAVEAVKNGSITAYAASKMYNIPRATIVNRVYGRKGTKSDTLGKPTALSKEVELELAENLHVMEKYGFGLTRKELLESVGEYVATNNIETPFRNGIPGEDWFLGFKERHNLSVKKPQPVEYARKRACRPAVIYPYFDLLEKTICDLSLQDKPSHIWNCDETSFCKDPTKSKVVGRQGYTSTRTVSSPGKTNVTVLLTCNAAGEKAPPLIVFKGKNVWDKWCSEDGYPGTVYAATKNGWMETQVFENFFQKVFLPTVGQKRPILLIYDGHATHVGINIIKIAREHDITILKIPPHSSDCLQPLDLAVNKAFKDKWDMALVKWQRLHIGMVLPNNEFARIVGQVWTQIDPKVCAAGFRKAGIYPLDKNVIPESKFDPVLLSEWKRKLQDPITAIIQQTTNESVPAISAFNSTQNIQSQVINSIQFEACRSPLKEIICPRKLSEIALTIINIALNKPQVAPVNFISEASCKQIHVSLNNCTPISKNDILRLKNHLEQCEPVVQPIVVDHDEKQSSNNKVIVNQPTNIKESTKFQILDDQSVKSNMTFEQILLSHIKSGRNTVKAKRKKVAIGAEVITHDDVYQRCKLMEIEKEKEMEKKFKKQEDKKNKKQAETSQRNKIKKEKKVSKRLETEKFNKDEENKQLTKQNTSNKARKRRRDSTSSSDNEDEIIYNDESDIDCDKFFEELAQEEEENVEIMMKYENEYKKKKSGMEKKIEKQEEKKESKQLCQMTHGEELLFKNDIDLTEKAKTNIDTKMNIDDMRDMLFSENEWVLVKFTAKKSVKHYVGIVLQMNSEGFPVIKYARKKSKSEDETIFTFPLIEDISEVKHREDIVSKLPKPTIGRRGQIIFKMSFNTFNIK